MEQEHNMTVADTILELNGALQDAKDAVTVAGGTVGDTGLAGLADEIASIPSGGSVAVGNYGKVAYYSKISFVVEDVMAGGCDAEIIDSEKLAKHVEHDFVELRYENGAWRIGWTSADTYTTEELESVVGVRITNLQDNFAMVNIMGRLSLDLGSERKECAIDTSGDFSEFCISSGSTTEIALPNGDIITATQIVDFTLGEDVTQLGNNFLYECDNLLNFDSSLATNLTTIGDGCLGETKRLYIPISFPTVTTVGNNFCHYSAVTSVTMANVTTVGSWFCTGCLTMQASPSIPKIVTIGNNFCSYCTFMTFATFSGNTLREIGESAFAQCPQLQTLGLYGLTNVTSIGRNFAYPCPELTTVNFPNNDISGSFNSNDINSFACSRVDNYSYLAGINATGNSAQIKARFPNTSNGPCRRWR